MHYGAVRWHIPASEMGRDLGRVGKYPERYLEATTGAPSAVNQTKQTKQNKRRSWAFVSHQRSPCRKISKMPQTSVDVVFTQDCSQPVAVDCGYVMQFSKSCFPSGAVAAKMGKRKPNGHRPEVRSFGPPSPKSSAPQNSHKNAELSTGA